MEIQHLFSKMCSNCIQQGAPFPNSEISFGATKLGTEFPVTITAVAN